MLDQAGNQGGRGAAPDGDLVEFFAAGVRVAGAYRCAECAYGVTIRGSLPSCPMCAGESWEAAPWGPFSRAGDRPDSRVDR